MEADVSYTPERLDHLGIVAGICPEIGLAELLDEHTEPSRQRVSVGTATLAMVLNGLGFSDRRFRASCRGPSRTNPSSGCRVTA